MKKIFILSLVLCGALWAITYSITATSVGQTSYYKIKLDTNYAYAVIQKPQGRGVTSDIIINGGQASCQTNSIQSDYFEVVCTLGKREKAEKAANISVLKNNVVVASKTIIYSTTTTR